MMPALLLLVLFGGALAIALTRRDAASRWLAPAAVLAGLAAALRVAVLEPVVEWAWWGPHLHPQLAVVGISRILIVLVPLIAFPVVLYAASAASKTAGRTRLLALLVAFTGAMELVAMAGDFLTLLIGWELVGACSWALIGHEWREAWRPRAALRAFLATRSGDLGLYVAAAAAVSAGGSLRFDQLAAVPPAALHIIAGGVLLAAAAKSAQLPFSPWLFSAMAGPTAASALLHSATMVAAGAYLVARLAPLLAPTGWFFPAVAWLGLATALGGGVVALLQSDLKKALAASTSAQYGLMFVALGAGATAAMTVHLVAHAAFKALLFLGAGMALHTAGTLDLGRLRLGSVLPVTARLVAIGALALAAVPPLGGAYSKEQILAAAAGASFARPWLAAGVTAAGFLSALYAGRLYLLAFGPGGPPPATQTEPPAERWSLALLAGLSVALGLLWIPAAARSVTGILPGALPEESPALLAASIGSIGLAAVLCWRWWSSGRLLTIGLPDSLRIPAAEWLGLPAMARRIVIDPARRFSGLLAVFDNKGVDAGIRTTAAIATLISNLMSGWTERRFDFAVAGVARWTTGLAGASGRTDDHGIDAAVEGVARDIGRAGQQSRRLQTGLAHHYYVILVAGALVAVAIAAFGR